MRTLTQRVVERAYWRYHRDDQAPASGLRRLPARAEAYRGLERAALLFDGIKMMTATPSVCLLLPSTRPADLSAGPMTAVAIARAIADHTGRPLRLITSSRLGHTPDDDDALRARLGLPDLPIDHVGDGTIAQAARDDLWIATAWTTAIATDVAARCEVIDPRRVVYLVQDYEPGFSSWSTQWAATRRTYHAGFHNVVNSTRLADYLRQEEGDVVDDDLVMAPNLDLDRLAQVARQRADRPAGVFFYARPSVPRNLYQLGVAALRRAATQSERRWTVTLAGETVPTPTIDGTEVVNLGKTSVEGYYKLMEEALIAFSLMLSPHPSHPPLDWATSGGWAVTNRFGNLREGIHPRLLTADADPDLLGTLLARTIDTAQPGSFIPPASLGRPLPDVVRSLADRLG